jgi:hypothetical protein
MKKQIISEEFLKMQKLAGLITEGQYKARLNENRTAETLYQMFKDEDLLNDRREYDVEDLMSTYPDLSKEEAKKLEKMLQDPSKLNENTIDIMAVLNRNGIDEDYFESMGGKEVESGTEEWLDVLSDITGKDAYEGEFTPEDDKLIQKFISDMEALGIELI